MPRRIPDYPDAYAGWNMISSVGAYISFASTLLFVGIAWWTLRHGAKVDAAYWGPHATTLEWTVSSPPPFHAFETLPQVK
jgi:cytochrome c oxidase subunit 1